MLLADKLRELDACPEAIEWAGKRHVSRNAWQQCHRGDWMLWLAEKLGVDRKRIVLAACDCAELALQYVPEGEGRPAEAIRVARAWCAGEATRTDVAAAAAAAATAASSSVNAAAANAADAATYVATAAYAAANAANAARAAANAAYAATAAAANAAYSYAAYAAANAASASVNAAANAYAADAYASGASAGVYDDAHAAMLAKCARLVRERIRFEELL